MDRILCEWTSDDGYHDNNAYKYQPLKHVPKHRVLNVNNAMVDKLGC